MLDGDRQVRPNVNGDRRALAQMCFRNLLANPQERVFFKDLDSRFLLVSAGFLLDQAQGCSLDEVIGKSDFDLFSDEHAIAAYQDEQRIIHTGEAMVAKIERETFHDRADAWVSTTKLPLRDDHGRDSRHLRYIARRHRPGPGRAGSRPSGSARRRHRAGKPAGAYGPPGAGPGGPGPAPTAGWP